MTKNNKNKQTYIIAEIGINHNGSLEIACEMIEKLSKTGVDAVKFQLAVPGNVYSLDAFKANYQVVNEKSKSPIEMSRRYQLKAEQHIQLKQTCNKNDVQYLCTAFDIESLIFLDKYMDMPFFKVPSGEINSLDLLNYISEQPKPILLSTGMASYDEIGTTINILNQSARKNITVLHCVSNYPASPEELNLRVINELSRRFACPVGYSDHSVGTEAAIAAVALGANVIEKHVTFDKNAEGPDHKASATIDEIGELVSSIRVVEQIMGSTVKQFSDEELQIKKMARKSIVARVDIFPGQLIDIDSICFKRPGTGISPLIAEKIIGQKASAFIEADRVIQYKDLA